MAKFFSAKFKWGKKTALITRNAFCGCDHHWKKNTEGMLLLGLFF